MSISILGGKAKGFTLKVIQNSGLRPTSVILRRKIFDRYQDISGVCFVDMCAGTGAMGLEACSRGASEVFFIENNKKFFSTLKQNINQFEDKYKDSFSFNFTYKMAKAQTWIDSFKDIYMSWDLDQRENTIIFVDPPYASKDVYHKLVEHKLLGENWFQGLLWIESDRLKGLPMSYWEEKSLNILGSYTHSDSYIIVAENSQ